MKNPHDIMRNQSLLLVHLLLRELESRSGFDGFWESMDEAIQEEIIEALVEITEDHLEKLKKLWKND